MGPSIIYDKSALQQLSREEASWLHHFFRGTQTPIIFAEVLGNLAKSEEGKDPSAVVRAFADKLNDFDTVPNVSHATLIEGELMGYPIEMRGAPVLDGGRRFVDANGKPGVFFDEPPEARILRRWEAGEFEDTERELAANWRTTTKSINLGDLPRSLQIPKEDRARFKTPIDAAAQVDLFLNNGVARFQLLELAFELFAVPAPVRRAVKARWINLGRPHLAGFAPYTFFALRIAMIFFFGVGVRAIPERSTNVIDVQYLYYLPFCHVFTSGDKLHRDLAPLFMSDRHVFVWAPELKEALRDITLYYKERADELRKVGRAKYAKFPPLDLDTVIHRAYDKVMPGWREDAATPEPELTPEQERKIMEQLKPAMDAIAKLTGRGEP